MTTFDYAFQILRVKRGTDNVAAEISYTALPLEVRGALEGRWRQVYGLRHWGVLEPRLESEQAVPAERLREISRDLLADIGEVWEGTAAELAVVVRHTLVNGGPRIVERGRVEKSENRRQRERVARKLGKGARHDRFGITLEGNHARWATWQEVDAFVRSRLTADDLRAVTVQWVRYSWDNFDNSHRTTHTVYADAEHLLGDRKALGAGLVKSTSWEAVRDTLQGDLREIVESLAGEWHGTGLELLDAARALEEVNA
jgi:hypothetical protein